MPRSGCQLRLRDPQTFLLLPLLARAHRHARILRIIPVRPIIFFVPRIQTCTTGCQGLKPAFFLSLTARLKPCPSQNPLESVILQRSETGQAPSLTRARHLWASLLAVGLSAMEASSFFNSSSAWANVRSAGTCLKPLKTSVELMLRLFTSRIFPVKFKVMLEISQRLSPTSCC